MMSAINNHSAITKDALMGQGIDRLLFGLRKIAEVGSALDQISASSSSSAP